LSWKLCVNNKMALDETNAMSTGGYNKVKANTTLADHAVQAIARPKRSCSTANVRRAMMARQ